MYYIYFVNSLTVKRITMQNGLRLAQQVRCLLSLMLLSQILNHIIIGTIALTNTRYYCIIDMSQING